MCKSCDTNYDRQLLIETKTKLEALEHRLDLMLNEYEPISKDLLFQRDHYLDRIKALTETIEKAI
jgi:archaellum component FlaC